MSAEFLTHNRQEGQKDQTQQLRSQVRNIGAETINVDKINPDKLNRTLRRESLILTGKDFFSDEPKVVVVSPQLSSDSPDKKAQAKRVLTSLGIRAIRQVEKDGKITSEQAEKLRLEMSLGGVGIIAPFQGENKFSFGHPHKPEVAVSEKPKREDYLEPAPLLWKVEDKLKNITPKQAIKAGAIIVGDMALVGCSVVTATAPSGPEITEPQVIVTPTYAAQGESVPSGFPQNINRFAVVDPKDEAHSSYGADMLAESVTEWVGKDWDQFGASEVQFIEVYGTSPQNQELAGGLVGYFEAMGNGWLIVSYGEDGLGYLGSDADPYVYSQLIRSEQDPSIVQVVTPGGIQDVFKLDENGKVSAFLPFGETEWVNSDPSAPSKVIAMPTEAPQGLVDILRAGGKFSPDQGGYVDASGKLQYVVGSEGLVSPEEIPLTSEILESGKWGTYTFTENSEGAYDMLDAQGNKVENLMLYKDGTATLSYAGKELTIAFQSIKIHEGKLIVGLWDYEGSSWSQTHSMSAKEMINQTETPYGLTVIREHEKENQMTDTIFAARDLVLIPETMRLEFEGIKVEYNSREYDTTLDFNSLVVPAKVEVSNFSREVRATEGLYRIFYFSKDSSLSFDGKMSAVEPMQVSLSHGWFEIKLFQGNESTLGMEYATVLHVPLVLVNPDGSFMQGSALANPDSQPFPKLEKISAENRGDIDFRLMTQNIDFNIKHYNSYLISNPDVSSFIGSWNGTRFSESQLPELDTKVSFSSKLPKEYGEVFFLMGGSFFR